MRIGSLLLLSFSLVAAPAGDSPATADAVRHGDLVKTLIFSGELQALKETLVNTPNITRLWVYPIAYLAPEGVPVQPGDVLASFDRTAMEYRRLEREKAREDARLAVARKETELEIRRQDLLLQLASAKKRFRIAELYAALDPELITAAEAEKYRYELSTARLEVEKLEGRLRNETEAGQAELEVEQLKLRKAELDLRQMVGDIQKMTIYATREGIPLYAHTSQRKVQVGDNVYKGSPVLRLPDMSQLKVRIAVFDSEFPALRLGQSAKVTLDAVPGRSFAGRVIWIPEAATSPRQRFLKSSARLFQVDVLLLETDPALMKPGMSARVEIPTRAGSGLLVPRSHVFYRNDGTAYVRPRGARPAQVEIIDSNHSEALVDGDLTPGTLLERPVPPSSSKSPKADWHLVKRDDLRFTVSGSGVLEAARSVEIGPPVVPNTFTFKIKWMAPEGAPVKAGDAVVVLDSPEVRQTLVQEESSLEKVRQELEKTQASLQLKLDTLELELEETRAAAEKASGKLQQARLFEAGLQIREAELEAELSRKRVALLEEKLRLTRQGVQLELELLKERENLHRQLAESARLVLSLLRLKAPRDGIVIYKKNWNNEKKQIGDDINVWQTILFLPELDSLQVAGQISELDAGRIRINQPVDVAIDALPDRTFRGRITEISQIFTQASPDRPVKVVEVKVKLDQIDTAVMRPGMVARLNVITDEFEDVLAVPLIMVRTDGGSSFVWVNRNGDPVKTAVEIGAANGVMGIVRRGLEDGDEILTHPPVLETNALTEP